MQFDDQTKKEIVKYESILESLTQISIYRNTVESLISKCKRFIGKDLETRTNGEALILSSALLFRGCFIPEYYKLYGQKVCDVIHLNIPDKNLMIYVKYLNFNEFNLKEDINQVRALAILHDKPILFIDPMNKAKQILAHVLKDLQIRKYDHFDNDFDERPNLFEKFNYKQDPNPALY